MTKKKAMTPSERVRKNEKDRIARGDMRISVWIKKEEVDKLSKIISSNGFKTITETITFLIDSSN